MRNANKTGLRSLDRLGRDPRVHEIYRDSDGIRVELERGYTADPRDAHDIHEDTVRDALDRAANIQECRCDGCYVPKPGVVMLPVGSTSVTTVAAINRVLRSRGHAERLRRGRGYYYFVDGNASAWFSSSVDVYRLIGTADHFADMRDELANDPRNAEASNA